MSGRGLSASMLAEIAKDSVVQCVLVKAEFDSGDLLLNDSFSNIDYDGDTYLYTKGMLVISNVIENALPKIDTLDVTLSGVDTTAANEKVLNDDFFQRNITIWYGFRVKQTGVLVADPYLYFTGRMDEPVIQDNPNNGTSTVTVSANGRLADFGSRPGRHTNNEDHQFLFPGDEFFEFVSNVPTLIDWGRK